MDNMVQHTSEENNNAVSYTLPEMWQFQGSNNNATSFGGLLAESMEMSMNLDMNEGNEGMNREHDPMVVDHYCNSNRAVGLKKRREDANYENNVNGKGFSNNTLANHMFEQNGSDIKRMKTMRVNEHGESKQEEQEADSGNAAEQTAKPPDSPKQDYIHVRARRGQATDSHSLAERARREKISERMKILQDLVPGCNKVIGKALVLDEIINYIQSLQRQVEFLSMKLEAVNPQVPPGIDGFPAKEFSQQHAFDASSLGFSSQAARDYGGTTPEWLHMQLGGGFERTS